MRRRTGFYALLLILLVLCLAMLREWLVPALLGVILGYLLYPVYVWIGHYVRSETARSAILVTLVFVAIALPALFIVRELTLELPKAVESFQATQQGVLDSLSNWLSKRLNHQINISDHLAGYFGDVAAKARHSATGLVGVLGSVALSLLVMLFTMYYILKDGSGIWNNLMLILPLGDSVKPLLAANLKQTLAGVLYGQFITAVALGVVCGVAYSIFGVQHVAFWILLTIIMAMIPIIGPNVVWAPLALSRLLFHHPGEMLGLIIVCGGAAFVIDNILKPKFIADRSELHPLAALLGVMGGLEFFGLIGFLFGPVLIGLLIAMLRFYRDVAVLRLTHPESSDI